MKYILTILITTIATALNAQSLCKLDPPLKFPGQIGRTLPDTLSFRRFPISETRGENNIHNFEPPSYGGTAFQYYPVRDLNGDVIVQNSVRKGGRYTDPNGKIFFLTTYWYRVVNNTNTPFELSINFPADSITTLTSPDGYLNIFTPPDTMSLDKTIMYAYGATHVTSFLDDGIKPTEFKKLLNPKEETLFYIGIRYYKTTAATRAELVVKENEIFYQLSDTASELDTTLIPIGKIIVKK